MMPHSRSILHCALWWCALTLQTSSAVAQESKSPLAVDITHTPIEELLNMNVTSVSKTEEAYFGSAAAVYVLTNDAIRRSGATSIPEALRLVPGVQVARIDANKWAVSVRGFNSRLSNKLLVLIDGREVYDLVFSGVLWESKDVMLEDVDRIEVVRGPGGTLWESNAVNGVINIITKHAKETQGALVSGGGGTEERGFGSARYGTKLGEGQYIRGYGKYYNRDSGFLPDGADDESWFSQGGMRFDSELGSQDTLTLQGDGYDGTQGNAHEEVAPDDETSGQNALAHWKHAFADGSELDLLAYYDHTRIDIPTLGRDDRHTGTADLQYRFKPGSRNRTIVGAHYRYSPDETHLTEPFALVPTDTTDELISGFIENRLELIKEELFLIIGSKFENNDYTGFEVQPTVRLSWLADEETFFWGAISRAVRVPSRVETDVRVETPQGPAFTTSRGLESEEVIAYELGARRHFTENLFVDVAAFINHYDDLVVADGTTFTNDSYGETYGAELSLRARPLPWWAVDISYSYLDMQLSLTNGSIADPLETTERVEGSNPDNQASIQCSFNLSPKWELDAIVRYVDSLPALQVDPYTVADIRLGYFVSQDLELSVVGQNLFDKQHFEQSGLEATDAESTEVQSGVYGKVLWRF